MAAQQGFYGINVDSSGVVTKPLPKTSVICFGIGDSFMENTGSNTGTRESFFARFCDIMGFDPWASASGGTGYTNQGAGGRQTYINRVCPPANAWIIYNQSTATGGTFTITKDATTTAAINYNAAYTAIQSALDTAFGAGNYYTAGHPFYGAVVYGIGTGTAAPLEAQPL